jgi:type IV secretory pathway VirB10-like protein
MTSDSPDIPVPPPVPDTGTPGRESAGSGTPDDPGQLNAKIEQTREQLGETVEQPTAKADVKERAQATAADLTDRAKAKTSQARQQAAVQAGNARSQLAATTATVREQASSASEAVPESVKRVVVKGGQAARQHRKPLAIAAGGLVLGALVVRWLAK